MTDPDRHDEEQPLPERPESAEGVPVMGSVVPDRFSSDEVFQRIVADADHEITSGSRELFFSALAGGFAITVTFLLYVSVSARTESPIAAVVLYPLGFLYIIIGGYQLYTENTLPPVALVLERIASVPALLRHWLIVLAGNFTGGALGALAIAYGGVFSREPYQEGLRSAHEVALDVGHHGLDADPLTLFVKGAFAGLVVAGVVWVEFASRDTVSRVLVVYLAFLAIPLGDLYHVVVSFTEVVYMVAVGEAALAPALGTFVLPVLLGNTIGGIVLVTVVNYYQTSEHRLETARFEDVRRLSAPEWLLGRVAGRSYVPLFDTVGEIVGEAGEGYRVMVPIANPRTESRLVDLACTYASGKEDATVHFVHIVQMPDRMQIEHGSGQHRRIVRHSDRLMADVRARAEEHDVSVQTSTVVTDRSFQQIFDTAVRTNPELVVMGWGENQLWSAARAERPLDELTSRLPCDFLVVRDRGLDASKILVPTAGGPDSELSADVAATLADVADGEVTLLHVVDGPEDRETGEEFLSDWARSTGLEDAVQTVDVSGNPEGAILQAAAEHSLLILGASERGLLSRLVSDSLHTAIVDEVDCTVLLAERPTDRTLRERLFGRGARAGATDT